MKASKPKRMRGRPKAAPEEIRRSVSVRLNTAEWNAVCRKADSVGLAPTGWMRQAALSRTPLRALVPAVNREAYAELAKLANNINQLARAAHEGKAVVSEDLLKETLATLRLLRLGLLGATNDCQTD